MDCIKNCAQLLTLLTGGVIIKCMKKIIVNMNELKKVMAANSIVSMAELSRASGLGYNTVWRLSKGYPFNSATVETIAHTLNVSPVALLAEA